MPPPALPLLLLDVDGVLLVVHSTVDDDAEIAYAPTLHPAAAAWLAELAASFELVWATTWEHAANDLFAPELGLPALPVIEFEMDHWAPTPKLPSVSDWVGERPCAWIDDDLQQDADSWAEGRAVPTLLVRTDMTEGMSRRHVDRLLAWAAELARE